MWKTLGQRWSSPALHTRRLFLPLLLPACGQGPSLGKRLAPGLLILPGHPEPMLAEGREQPLAVPMSDAAWTAFWAQGMLARGRREGRREGGREGGQYARGDGRRQEAQTRVPHLLHVQGQLLYSSVPPFSQLEGALNNTICFVGLFQG